MKLWFEKWYPHAAGLLAALAYLSFLKLHALPDSLSNLMAAVVSISAIAIGFLATSKSILISIQNRRFIRQIKELKLYDTLIGYLMTAINYCFCLALMSAAALLVDYKTAPGWFSQIFCVWIFFGVAALLSCYRVIRIFSLILRTEM